MSTCIDDLTRQLEKALDKDELTYGLAKAIRATLRETELYRNHQHGRTQLQDFQRRIQDSSPAKVQIGGGGHMLPKCLSIDVAPPADLLWDVREGIPLTDASVDFIFSEHFLEHIDYPQSAKLYAAETHRILQPGRTVITGVPDAGKVMRGYASTDEGLFHELIQRWYSKRNCLDHFNTYIDLVNYVFRDQDDDETYTPHCWAYDTQKLSSLFTDAGFDTVEPWQFDPAIARPKREWGSLYVIATK